jgi:hypothetical protein
MNAKELKIEAPEGYEVDWDNSSKDTIRFKSIKKKITYQDVKAELFEDSKKHYIESAGNIYSSKTIRFSGENTILATSKNQIEQLLALNKLMNVTNYLNGDWEPDWNNEYENKFCIFHSFGKLNICNKGYSNFGCAVFKSRDLALQAIEILGEQEIKKALGIFE